MKISKMISCKEYPCSDVHTKNCTIPEIELNPDRIQIVMISEAPSINKTENFYEKNNGSYMQATVQLFNDAGVNISSIKEVIDWGIYITTAIKCPKKELSVSTSIIKNCSFLLEQELKLFSNTKAVILNGDIAIRSINYSSKREDEHRIIPAGSTYKIRKDEFIYKNIRYFPSYILTGKNLLIEKSKRKMITEDIKEALTYIQ